MSDSSAQSAFSFPGRTAQPIGLINSGTTAFAISASTSKAAGQVVWFQVTEIAGGTANLTLDLFDGTTAYVFHRLTALTAGQELLYARGWWLPIGWSIRATCSIASNISVVGLQTIPAQSV